MRAVGCVDAAYGNTCLPCCEELAREGSLFSGFHTEQRVFPRRPHHYPVDHYGLGGNFFGDVFAIKHKGHYSTKTENNNLF